MSSDHYFSAQPATPEKRRTISVEGWCIRKVETSGGIFSPDRIDKGTAVLLESVPDPSTTGNLLDIGCGLGPIALSMALASPEATVYAVDVNERSIGLTRDNARSLGLGNVKASLPEEVDPATTFDTIWSKSAHPHWKGSAPRAAPAVAAASGTGGLGGLRRPEEPGRRLAAKVDRNRVARVLDG